MIIFYFTLINNEKSIYIEYRMIFENIFATFHLSKILSK